VLATRLNRLPDWLRLVATTRKDPAVLERLQGLRADRLETHSPENAADIADFVRIRLSGAGLTIRLKDLNISAATIAEHIIRQSDGNFLYAQQTLDGIERGLIDAATLDRLPPGLSGLYQNRLVHQFPDAASFSKARTVFEIAIASQEPLPEALLAAASGFDSNELTSVLRELSAYLPMRLAQDGRQHYAIYHKSLADWLTDPKRRGSVHVADVHLGHERLATSLWRELREGVANMSAYGLAHLATHLIELQRWNDIATLLTDVAYLEARSRAGQVFDLAKDFTRAWQALPTNDPMKSTLQLIDEALRRDIQFIHAHREDYPQALFQCLWNYGWWYDGRPPGIASSARTVPADGSPAGGYLARLFGISQQPSTSSAAPAEHARAPSEGAGTLSRHIELMRAETRRGTASRLWLRALSPPPESLGSPQRLVLHGHKEAIIGVWFLPDEQLMSASKDGAICLWETVTGLQRSAFTFGPPVRGLDFITIDVTYSPADGRLARAAWVKKEIRRQNPETKVWETFELRDPTISGNYITFAKSDGSEMTETHGGTARVMDLAFGAGGAVLAVAQADGVVLLLDTRSGQLRGLFDSTKPPAALTRIAGAPPSGQTNEASDDPARAARSARFLEQDEIDVMFEHRQNVSACSVAVSPDGKRVACGTWSEALHIWDVTSGAETCRL
jgi:hypothetical protein